MKKYISFCLVMFLAISLFLPIYSMADMTLTLEDLNGNRIYTPGIKSFAVGPNNNLIIYLNQPFTFKDLAPDIFLGSCTSCAITGPAEVSVTQGANLSFNVQSNDAYAVISLEAASWEITSKIPSNSLPLPIILSTTGGGIGAFSWDTTNTPTSSYIALFQAKVSDQVVSQLPVTINVNPPETISTPVISGQSVGTVSQSYTFTASGATVIPSGDPVQYLFTWGDGSNSGWLPAGTTSASKSGGWAVGTYSVTVQARCATHTSVVSGTSTAQITISNIPSYTLTVNISGGGTVSVNQQPYTSPMNFTSGTVVNLLASPSTGYNFSGWSGGLSGSTNPTTITMNSDKSVTATFTQPQAPPAGELLPLNTYLDKYIPGGTNLVFIIRISENNIARLRMQIMGTSSTTLATYNLKLNDGREYPALLGYQNQIIGSSSMIYLELRSQLASGGGNITGNYLPAGDHVLTISAQNTSNLRIWGNVYIK